MAYIVFVKQGKELLETFDYSHFLDVTHIDDSNLKEKYRGYINSHSLIIYSLLSDNHELIYDTEKRVHDAVLNNAFDYDAFLVENPPKLNEPGILVMDMDMTSVQIEGIDEIARALGKFDEISRITHEAMQGNMDFNASLKRRVSLLRGGDASVLDKVKSIMTETKGLDVLINTLKNHSWGVGIASGGFTQLISVLEDKYKLDMVRANTLSIKNGKFTGRVVGSIVNAEVKAQALIEFRGSFDVPFSQTICIGDGANDLKMISVAGLGVAYHAKHKVQEKVPVLLNHSNLMAIAAMLEALSSI